MLKDASEKDLNFCFDSSRTIFGDPTPAAAPIIPLWKVPLISKHIFVLWIRNICFIPFFKESTLKWNDFWRDLPNYFEACFHSLETESLSSKSIMEYNGFVRACFVRLISFEWIAKTRLHPFNILWCILCKYRVNLVLKTIRIRNFIDVVSDQRPEKSWRHDGGVNMVRMFGRLSR